MNRTLKLYIAFLVLIIVGIIVIDSGRPKPINWTPSYTIQDKIPFGLYVFNKEIPSLFPKQKIVRFGTTVYEFLDPKYSYADSTYTAKGTILMISDQNTIDDTSADELLYFVDHGNTAFLSMQSFPKKLMDSLKFDYSTGMSLENKMLQKLSANNLKDQTYNFHRGSGNVSFSSIDSTTTDVLGYQQTDTVKNANFIRVPYGMGYFLLHTQPAAFSNYVLLKDKNAEYCSAILSYIPKGELFWQSFSYNDQHISGSPMRYILSQPALKWAWYLFLIGMFVFMLFNAKRRQRVIPIKEPVPNTTVDFTKTIGNLYLQEGSHHLIIEKKIIYFLEKIRSEYLIDTFQLDETFVKRLHQKTGKDPVLIEKVVRLIQKHRNELVSTQADVIEISKAIEKLK
ncbi:DUF4350 domain-containing protein [Flavobacterium supellecticarium]|uniref:DUF4350 domain-containing protein n=1 Tax=Flavobacterium supellecticarium TaxID=2565924 RepID=A0A4S3ZZZ6_9FLAO|nr:DUF4350 domain-containing protein [Flavobacterium supellecticarium]THF51442.1 DUF4350 domain-containing protein [Flavobacterium supellecticarium]